MQGNTTACEQRFAYFEFESFGGERNWFLHVEGGEAGNQMHPKQGLISSDF